MITHPFASQKMVEISYIYKVEESGKRKHQKTSNICT